jgi:hypothetical protein
MSDEQQNPHGIVTADDLSRRQWLLRLGGGRSRRVSGLVPESAASSAGQDKTRHEPLPLCRLASTTLRLNIWFTR